MQNRLQHVYQPLSLPNKITRVTKPALIPLDSAHFQYQSSLMADPSVQRVREWLESQSYCLRVLTLLLFLEEAVKDEFGEQVRRSFDKDLREAFRRLPMCREERESTVIQ
jgi:hypothetical protein